MGLWKTLLIVMTATLLLGVLAACGTAEPTPTQSAVAEGPVPTPTSAAPTTETVVAGTLRSGDIVASGAAPAPAAQVERPELGGTINYVSCCTGAITLQVDPWDLRGSPYGYLWFNSPVQMKFPFDPAKGVEYEPGLATEWSTSADGTKWTLKLRQGATWHDGEAFNADDMVATLERGLDPKMLITARQIPMRSIFTGIKKVDTYTVVLDTGEKPNSTAFAYLSSHLFSVVPEHLIKGDPTSPDVEKRWKFMAPEKKEGAPGTQAQSGTLGVGTGPFKMAEWNREVVLIGEKYANYWKFDEFGNRLPYADRFVHTAVPDATRRLARFVAGTEDYSIGSGAGMHPNQAKALCASTRGKGCSIFAFPHGYFAQFLNYKSTPIFADVKVSAAARYIQDMQEIVDLAYGGRQGFMVMDRGRYPETALTVKEQYATLPWSDPARRPEFRQKAQDLMNAAGLEKGVDLPFPIFSGSLCSGSFLDEYSRHVDQWQRIGLRGFLECRQGIIYNEEMKAGRWSIQGPGGSIFLLDPGYGMILWHLLDSSPVGQAPWRHPGQEEMDAKFRATVRTVDPAKRNEGYKDIERLMANPDLTTFPTGYTVVHLSLHSCIHNFRPGGTWDSHAWSHEKTWLSGDCKK